MHARFEKTLIFGVRPGGIGEALGNQIQENGGRICGAVDKNDARLQNAKNDRIPTHEMDFLEMDSAKIKSEIATVIQETQPKIIISTTGIAFVNRAGEMGGENPIQELDDSFKMNTTVPATIAQVAQEFGRENNTKIPLVHLGSTLPHLGIDSTSVAYATSKAAAETLFQHFAPQGGVQIISAMIGYLVRTQMTEGLPRINSDVMDSRDLPFSTRLKMQILSRAVQTPDAIAAKILQKLNRILEKENGQNVKFKIALPLPKWLIKMLFPIPNPSGEMVENFNKKAYGAE